ncbi:hypothetical protein HG530_000647 [Fusarium avenaceum]|nr:hypothetical protein HG530_000647 [Fusarium avenaceum]
MGNIVVRAQMRIPRSCAQACAVVADAQATDTVLVADQRANLLASGDIPDLDILLALRRPDTELEIEGQFAKIHTYPVKVEFAIRANIEETTSSIIRSGDEGVAVREELDSVDIRLVTSKGLDGLSGADIPELGERITSTRDKGVLVGRVEADAHDVAEMVGKLSNLLSCLDIPLHTGHVTRRRQNAAIVDESTAREITGMARELTSNTGRAVALLVQVVDGADVVETTASNKVATRGVGAGHNPG